MKNGNDGPRDWHGSHYARLYFSLIGDPKFRDIVVDASAFGTYALMLLAHEASFPHPAAVPAGCPPSKVRLLAERGIIDMVSKHHFEVRGLASERAARSGAGRKAAMARWHGQEPAEYE